MSQHKSLSDYLESAKKQIKVITPGEANEKISQSVVAVDVRDKNELMDQGQIPNAIHISRGMLEFVADPESPFHNKKMTPGMEVIVYCASGGRSSLAAATLKEMGYDAASIDGGFKAWVLAGNDVADYDAD